MVEGQKALLLWLGLFGIPRMSQQLISTIFGGCGFRTLTLKSVLSMKQSWPNDHAIDTSVMQQGETKAQGTVHRVMTTFASPANPYYLLLGTRLRYKPGVIVCGGGLVHDCGTSRGIGYFLEPLILLALFAKKNLQIVLRGVTNGLQDPGVDTFRTTTLPLLRQFGVSIDGDPCGCTHHTCPESFSCSLFNGAPPFRGRYGRARLDGSVFGLMPGCLIQFRAVDSDVA